MVSKNITWDELAKHNVANDCWFVVRGKVYNVTSWIPKHPGGSDTIVLNGGRDATQLFEAYHPIKIYSMLNPYYVGDIQYDGDHPHFPPMSKFYITLKEKLENYFATNKINPRAYWEMIFRSVLLVSLSLLFHYNAVVSSSALLSFGYAILAGIVYALICFMPVHEGSHASTSNSPFLWLLLGSVHDFVNGSSFYNWCHQHFLGHHPFTNVTTGDTAHDAIDPDIYTNDPDIRRIKPHQPFHDRYRFQKYYVPMLYGLLGIKSRINDFVILYGTKMNGAIRVNPMNAWHSFNLLAGKIVFFIYRIVVPAYYFGLEKALIVFLIEDLITSYVLAFVFQVNHVVQQAVWPVVDKKTGLVNMDWAEMQLRTSLDYGHDSYWTFVLTGALNYQVTHHLVPWISQVHYREIAPIIKDHCKQYNLPYHTLPTFWDALKEHCHYLAVMGHAHSDF
eukprot:TRINITY_DN3148_c0_g1_i1.p1 TRINITY_DN3148_c0_g1~~TRINITY_DN3148_c0_g1_i1.p1  ORF type:complete len:448 (+),score=87.19 TRINITY_DN3148_c0_g1_i1:72-1415(+)